MTDEKNNDAQDALVVPDVPSEWFIAGRELFQDMNVSLEARAIVGYVLSRPPNWKVRVRDLMRQGDIGRDKLRRIFRELLQNGYMKRERLQGRNGRFDWRFTVSSVRKFGVYEKPCTEKPATAEPATADTSIYKEKNLQKKEPKGSRSSKSDSRERRSLEKGVPLPIEHQTLSEEWRTAGLKVLGDYVRVYSVESEFDEFVDHYTSVTGKALLRSDWRKAWLNWLRKTVKKAKEKNIVPPPAPRDPSTPRTIRERREVEKGATT